MAVVHWVEVRGSRHKLFGEIMLGAPHWYSVYCAAILESDRNKAAFQIACAQRAIQERVAELGVAPAATPREPQDLNHASTHLRILVENIDTENERIFWD